MALLCLAPGRLRSVAMRRPSLGDVFVRLTGRGLVDAPAAGAELEGAEA